MKLITFNQKSVEEEKFKCNCQILFSTQNVKEEVHRDLCLMEEKQPKENDPPCLTE